MKRLLQFGRSPKMTAKVLGTVLVSGLLSFGSAAQTTFTLGTGTATNSNVPITSNFGYSYSQQIMYASEIQAAGGGAGSISKIRFFLASGTTTNSDNWRVLIGHTTKTQFTSNTDWEVAGNLTEVFNGTVTFPAAGNWMEITLATPFNWDGVNNIAVAIDENTQNWGALVSWRHTTTTGVNRGIYYRNDNTNPDPATPPTATGRTASFPNMQLVMAPSTPCGTPAVAATVSSSATACVGSTVNLSLNNSFFQSGIQYQWQKNETGTWEDISGANSSTFTSAPVLVNTDFRANVTCGTTTQTTASTPVTVTAVAYPVISLNQTNVATCQGEPANITVTGADTYTWSPATALTPNVNAATVNVIPTVSTVYRVIGSTSGCTDTATVTVTPVADVTASTLQSPLEICEPGSTVTLSLDGLPSYVTSDGAWQYRWLAANGTTEAQTWNSSNEFAFIPTEDSVYSYYYQLRSTSCPNNYIDSMRMDIVVGFGADVALTPFNCNSNGIIALSDIFGQRETAEVYDNAFANGASMTNVTITGSTAITDNRLVITPSATGVSGYAQIAVPGQTLGANNAMTVSFKLTADLPINNFGTGGADGITYSFGSNANPAGNGTPQNGKGNGLRLSFDSADNGSENSNTKGIYLVYGWTATNAFGPASAQTIAYSNNTALWKTLTDVPVTLQISTAGKATLTVNGTVIFNNVQMPAAYMAANTSSWTHLFSAGTGGDALRHAVKDVSITASSLQIGLSQGAATVLPAEWQTENMFEDLLPGVYNVWLSKDESGTCSKNIGQFEILNTNPVVDLGADTTICEGESLTVDAGNPGSVYTWSGSNAYTQTLEIDEAGSYIVYVTNPEGCLGIGTINVDMQEAPSANGIFANGDFPTVMFSAVNAQNTDSYSWNFGDGTTVNNGPASVLHTYEEDGTYTVTLTLTNGCGTETVTQSISITDYASLSENHIEGLEVYPNPATSNVTVKLPANVSGTVAAYAMSGALVAAPENFAGQATLNVNGWEKGVYFLHVSNGTTTTIQKLIVQ
jgi:PKD repeat protein